MADLSNPLYVSGVKQLIYAQTTIKSGDTVSNTSAKTVFASQIIFPGNTALVGQVFRAKGYGVYNAATLTTGTTTCGVQLLNGSTSAVVSMATTPALANAINLSSIPYEFEIDMVIQAIGAAGVIRSSGRLTFNTTTTTSTTITLVPVTNTVDTTVQQTMQVWTQFSIASPSINSTLSLFYVDVLQPVPASN